MQAREDNFYVDIGAKGFTVVSFKKKKENPNQLISVLTILVNFLSFDLYCSGNEVLFMNIVVAFEVFSKASHALNITIFYQYIFAYSKNN